MSKKVLNAMRLLTDQPLHSDFTTNALGIQWLDNVGFQVLATGEANEGTLTVEVSFNHKLNVDGSVHTEGDWEPVSEGGNPVDIDIEDGTPASSVLELEGMTAPFIRLSWATAYIETGTITTVADVAGSLNDTYFFFTASDGTEYYVWFNVDDTGTDPEVEGMTGLEVDISEDDTAAAVATALEVVLETVASCTVTDDDIALTQDSAGHGALEDSVAAPTGFTFTYTEADGAMNVWASAKSL